MKGKKGLWTAIFVLLAAAVFAIVLILSKGSGSSAAEPTADPFETKEFASLDEAVAYAEFRMVHTDRLNGYQALGYVCSKRKIIVDFGEGGTITKTLIMEGETLPSEDAAEADGNVPSETAGVLVDGMEVLFYGSGVSYTGARWEDNGFEYVIRVNGSGVTADAMTEYVAATR